MILHNISIFLIILFSLVQSVSNNGHRTAAIATFSKFDLDIFPNLTVRFQISHIRWKALLDTNLTVPVLGESDGRISRYVHSKSMVEIHEWSSRCDRSRISTIDFELTLREIRLSDSPKTETVGFVSKRAFQLT